MPILVSIIWLIPLLDMMIDTILFDLDGTLADTAGDLANALNAIRLQYDLPQLPHHVIRPVVSHGSIAMIKLAFNLPQESVEFETIRTEFLQYYRDHIANETRLFDGMEAVLQSIEDNHQRWGIVTNKPAWLTAPLLQALSLDKRAACAVSGDTLAYRKPHPAPILHACNLIQTNLMKTVYIGDTEADIQAGKRAGTKTLAALYGYLDEADQPANWQADGMVTHAIEIIDQLHELNHD